MPRVNLISKNNMDLGERIKNLISPSLNDDLEGVSDRSDFETTLHYPAFAPSKKYKTTTSNTPNFYDGATSDRLIAGLKTLDKLEKVKQKDSMNATDTLRMDEVAAEEEDSTEQLTHRKGKRNFKWI